jgi:hypothetical protein
MILRRFAEALKQQNWAAIAIEFVLLVGGVFLGIQVANWNQQRLSDKQGEIFTERLHADLRIEAWNFEYLIQYYGEVQANAERALAVLEGESVASNEQLLISAYRATQFLTGTTRRATYDEMRSTGSLGLVKRKTLRDAADLVYADGLFAIVENQNNGSRYREAFRMRVPMDVQIALGEQCGDRFVTPGDFRQMVGSLNYDCTLGLKQEAIDRAAQALRNDDSIIPLLRLRLSDVRTVIANQTTSTLDTRRALRAVAKDTP